MAKGTLSLTREKTKKVAKGALSLTRGKTKSSKGLFNCEEGKKNKNSGKWLP